MFLVVFRNRKRADLDGPEASGAYDAEAAHMESLARQQPGFLSFKSYAAEDGEVVAISEWESEAHARRWGAEAEHRVAQARGRSSYYAEYTLFACADPRIHHFTQDKT